MHSMFGEPIAGLVECRLVSCANNEVVTSFGQYAGDHFTKPTAGACHQRHFIDCSHARSSKNDLTTGSNFKCT
jgi:hypothetical protein